MTDVGASVSASGVSFSQLDRNFGGDFMPSNAGTPASGSVSVTATFPGGSNGSAAINYLIPPSSETLSYTLDGALSSDGIWTYTYDAENRLVSQSSTYLDRKLDFSYDWQNRRIEKKVSQKTSGTVLLDRKLIYDGGNLVAEIDGTTGHVYRGYAWGLDKDGGFSGSGNAGALVEVRNYQYSGAVIGSGSAYYPTYDGNGNVAALIRSDGFIAATYEYSPFGEILRDQAADMTIADNTIRFGTKYRDSESGLIYDNRRYFSPSLGRFISRDPIAEDGGLNLYGYSLNDPINAVDNTGLDETYNGTPMLPFIVFDIVGGSGGARVIGVTLGGTRGSRTVKEAQPLLLPKGVKLVKGKYYLITDKGQVYVIVDWRTPDGKSSLVAITMPDWQLQTQVDGQQTSIQRGFWNRLVHFMSRVPDPDTGLTPAQTLAQGEALISRGRTIKKAYGSLWPVGLLNEVIGGNKIGAALSGSDLDGSSLSNEERWADGIIGGFQMAGALALAAGGEPAAETGTADSSMLANYLNGSGGRWGGTSTRLLNDSLATDLENSGYTVTGGAGRASEEWIPGPGGGTAGGTFVDLTATNGSSVLRIQTISTLSDGITPTASEAAAAARIQAAFPNDQLLLVPKW